MRTLFVLSFLLLSSFSYASDRTQFREALSKVGAEHPQLLAKNYAALAEKSASLSSLLAWTPSLTAQGSIPVQTLGTKGSQDGSLEARINLFRFGGDVSRFNEGLANRQKADGSALLNVIEVEERAARAFFDWIDLQKRLESQRTFLEMKKELVRVALEKYRRGQLAEQEVEKVRLDTNNLEIQYRRAEIEFLDLKAAVKAWLPSALEIKNWPWSEVSSKETRKIKAVQDRIRFQQLNLDAELRSKKVWQATSDWLPSLDLSSRWQTSQVSPLGNGTWSSYLVLTIPLWDRGLLLSERQRQAQLELSAQAELQNYRAETTARLETLSERREKALANLKLALSSGEKAKVLLQESSRRFQMGRGTVNDLLIDLSRVVDADRLSQESLKQYHLLLLESCLAADEKPSTCY